MALLLNICKYNDCGLVFPNLNQLIQHIEKKHISFDADYVKKLELAKPAALPLSYVLPSSIELLENAESDEEFGRPRSLAALTDAQDQNLKAKMATSDEICDANESATAVIGNCEDETNPDDAFTFDFIMRYGSKRSLDQTDDKPFVCPIPECTKRYKNVNGLRYHAKNGHRKNLKPVQKYECYCGRSYKTPQGLRAHAMALHNIALILPNSSSLPQTEETNLSLLTLANMPNDSFEQIHDTNEESNTHQQIMKPSSLCLDLSGALSDEIFFKMAQQFERAESESTSNMACDGSEKTENDENSCTSSSSAWQDVSDVDAKTAHSLAGSAKKESLDDDEIDVGDANDTVYPFCH